MELLIAIVCFLVAALPIISIFSFNIENSKVIQARAITFSAVREIMTQVELIPVSSLVPDHSIDLPVEGGVFRLYEGDPLTDIVLSAVPKDYSRKVRVEPRNGNTRSINIEVRSADQPRADIEIQQTVGSNHGGR